MPSYDAVVVGSGPNGLSAAVTLARAGRSVLVLEARDELGGGCRTAELTLPGFRHDVCSAIHPLAVASPFFRAVPLEKYGLEWVHPTAPFAQPLDDGTAAVCERSLEATADALRDPSYAALMRPFVDAFDALCEDLLSGFLRIPRHPFSAARFGLKALESAKSLAEEFETARARALFAGAAAHSFAPLESPFTAAFGLILTASAHAVGWPMPRGGAQAIPDALTAYLRELGGEIRTGVEVRNVDDLPPSRAVLLDVTPAQVVDMAGHRLPPRYVRALSRYRYGPAVFKVDFALDGAVPWAAEPCARAGTVHIGGVFEEVAAAERATNAGEVPNRPFILAAQHTAFDRTRAPEGKHTLWAYCHVPHGTNVDMTERIEAQIERFAPGFRKRILAKATRSPAELQAYNPNCIGGDISGGSQAGLQLFFRPTVGLSPYATPNERLFLCSSSTPPGPGVHGMCGYLAAQAVLARWR